MLPSGKKNGRVPTLAIDYFVLAEQSLSAHMVAADGVIVYCNGAFETLTGFSGEELSSLGSGAFARLFDRGSLALFEKLVKLCLDGGQMAYHPEIGLVRKDGSLGWIEMTINPIAFEGKNAIHCSCVDRTELRRLREITVNTGLAQRAFLDTLPFPAMILDLRGNVVSSNRLMVECTGWTHEEMIGGDWGARCLVDRKAWLQMLETIAHTSVPVDAEYDIQTKDGERRVVFLRCSPQRDARGQATGFVCVAEDVTDRRRTERVMHENQEKFVRMIEHANNGIALSDEEGYVIAWNRGFETIAGLKREEVLGKFLWDIIHRMTCDEERTDDTYGRIKLFHEEVLSNGVLNNTQSFFQRMQRPDGTRKIVNIERFVVPTARGYRIGMVVDDVTELFAAQDALRECETRYRCLAETVPDIVFMIARDGTIVFANAGAARFLSLPAGDVIGKRYREIFPAEAVIVLDGALARIFESAIQVRQEHTLLDAWLDTRLVPVVDAAGLVTAALWVSQDVTRRKTAEMELLAHKERSRKKAERSQAGSVFSMSKLFAITGNDPATLGKFLELTLLTGVSMVDNIERSLEGNDLGKVVLLANGIRDTALQLGATRLAETCAAVMLAARETRIEACRQLVPRLRCESERLFEALRAVKRERV